MNEQLLILKGYVQGMIDFLHSAANLSPVESDDILTMRAFDESKVIVTSSFFHLNPESENLSDPVTFANFSDLKDRLLECSEEMIEMKVAEEMGVEEDTTNLDAQAHLESAPPVLTETETEEDLADEALEESSSDSSDADDADSASDEEVNDLEEDIFGSEDPETEKKDESNETTN